MLIVASALFPALVPGLQTYLNPANDLRVPALAPGSAERSAAGTIPSASRAIFQLEAACIEIVLGDVPLDRDGFSLSYLPCFKSICGLRVSTITFKFGDVCATWFVGGSTGYCCPVSEHEPVRTVGAAVNLNSAPSVRRLRRTDTSFRYLPRHADVTDGSGAHLWIRRERNVERETARVMNGFTLTRWAVDGATTHASNNAAPRVMAKHAAI